MPQCWHYQQHHVKNNVGLTDPCDTDFGQADDMGGAIQFGQLIRSLRREYRLTQAELAAAIGVVRSTIAGIERGHYMPGRETLLALADFFCVSVDQLRDGTIPPRTPRKREVVDDPDELALLAFWRGLNDDQRRLMLRLLERPKKNDRSA